MPGRLLLKMAFAGALAAFPWSVTAQQKLEGKVLSTKLTACTMKPGGCEGTMVIETGAGGQPAQITIKVPLGTMIKKDEEIVFLPALRGRVVVVDVAPGKDERIARAISVK